MNFDKEKGRREGSEYGSPVRVGKSLMKCFREAFRTLRSRMLERGTPRDGRENAEDKLYLLRSPA